ncbi:MAG: prepilin-type N-terminal cleavage/methylation domain-containing protein [Candidatus Omnitrophica bacterium]|jgi:prepilin-type N-terminal cleavage/methylation domain-containing protein|nr:prepilin-type N-terminal cleavage/methylation domain-containing protein [Candidatus Omnitrophota bacterium]MDD5512470.1 prepilin-type N-terminal cleavage/methylation domain-containing protein [Candidatus Omnitrophota bacterium]
MKKGFTLLELIVVIIIIGILATLGFMQYQAVIEKSRRAEGRTNLGTLRQLQVAYHEDPVSTAAWADLGDLETGLPAACAGTHYFSYTCSGGDAGDGSCTASRCTAGGKPPQAAAAYDIVLSVDGTLTE